MVKRSGKGDRQISLVVVRQAEKGGGGKGDGDGKSETRRKIGKTEGAWAKREEERSYIDFWDEFERVDDVTPSGEVEGRQTRRGEGRADAANRHGRRSQARPVRETQRGRGAGCGRVLTLRYFTFIKSVKTSC
ncbi:hypothetical protein AJ78_07766 [Emergomyces pasteurianus Ep9510]|uniref:Uncharacterized protein n=1 Tax=Emergomyces pasteurianus Ep9510 TaxID=1447872 RepID=A0A1J9Q6A5_9EURO|nr:hypothetical protein AJ78_07766 [Emergomyces pasteurianus Ep9510]